MIISSLCMHADCQDLHVASPHSSSTDEDPFYNRKQVYPSIITLYPQHLAQLNLI